MNILKKLTTQYLKQNRKRTIVTIIGIILSGAMITAVATLAVSFQSFMLNVEISQDGAWEAIFKDVKIEDIQTIKNDKRFEKTLLMMPIGIAQNPYSEDPFLYIKAYNQDALENMKIHLIEGHLPQNDNEIVLSKSFFDGKENEPKIGDTLTIDIGKRISDGYELISEQKKEGESFVKEETKTYLVCGIIEKPDFETSRNYYTSGVTRLDETKPITSKVMDIGVISKKVQNIYEDTKEIAEEIGLYDKVNGEKIYKLRYNTYVLAYMGVNGSSGFNEMLYSVCGILIAVIMIGSILVIYNSFAISVSERKKQFGMLSSIGATKKQIRKSVLYEGICLGMIGIPLGIVSGIGGIAITLKIVDNLLKPILSIDHLNWSLSLVISWQAIFIAVLFIAITIYLSVTIPAKRASKISPIEAIRGNDDIKMKGKKLKTPNWIRTILGIEGEMALKNLKRSKKRYRTTVLSLMISIILFVSVSGFVGYMYNGFDSLYRSVNYDYSISIYSTENEQRKIEKERVKKQIEETDLIDKRSIIEQSHGITYLPKDKMDSRMLKEIEKNKDLASLLNETKGKYNMNVVIMTLNNEEMQSYLKELGLSKLEDNQAILIHYINLLQMAQIEGNITSFKEKEVLPVDISYTDQQTKKRKEITKEYEIAKVTDKMPYGVQNMDNPRLIVITTENAKKEIEQDNFYTKMYFTAKDETALKAYLEQIQKENLDLDMHVENIKELIQMQRNLKAIINIFLYGFIALISAIGIANIFNTISTNIHLRRREFAMLKSIGMTDKAFKKMLDLECVFYGTKALLYGLPIGILICFFINQGFGNLIQFAFNLPWSSIIISIIAVYLVVFTTMIYASRKIKRENIMDILRDENI